ncbi:putative PadR family transcriptional regulator [Oscillibacter valericigenes Sjm18-20]|nr:putative PadR family transcriptional regulator [Oscillibacter valericigenes Sjm18-20]
MIPLYILGLLQRFGPQHGYQIKKTIAEQLSDFTQVKLPTIYYHLEKMEANGLLSASREKPGSRPEKTIYTITDQGEESFQGMLAGLLDFEYRPTFPSDGVFYFSDSLHTAEIAEHLKNYIEKLRGIIDSIQKHKKETLQVVPEETKTMVQIIFSHHERHYQAELDWAEESLGNIEGE